MVRMTKNIKYSHFEVCANSRLKTAGFEHNLPLSYNEPIADFHHTLPFFYQKIVIFAFPQGQYRVSAHTGTPDFFYRAAKVA